MHRPAALTARGALRELWDTKASVVIRADAAVLDRLLPMANAEACPRERPPAGADP
ncbi:hypothetical protein [Streptomyces sp. NPDC048438]|uniref:hypothetical protein n=1 Tax=Streptomyces sp. NPDC048438 TaxID=3365551 RepID=UPI003718A811